MEQLEETKATPEQRTEMMEILERFEVEELERDRFVDLDLDKDPLDSILQRLTIEEREQFDLILKTKGALDILIPEWVPWWTKPAQNAPSIIDAEGKADVIEIPLVKNIPNLVNLNPLLCFTILDFTLSYIAASRTLNGDIYTDPRETIRIVLLASHVLSTDPKFVYQSVDEVLDIFQNRTKRSDVFIDNSTDLFFKDLLSILRDRCLILSVLSDLSRIFDEEKSKETRGVSKKLDYFIALTQAMETELEDLFVLAIAQRLTTKQIPNVNLSVLIQEI